LFLLVHGAKALLDYLTERLDHAARWPLIGIYPFLLLIVALGVMSAWVGEGGAQLLTLPLIVYLVAGLAFTLLDPLTSPEFAWVTVGGRPKWLYSITSEAVESERTVIMNALANEAMQGGEPMEEPTEPPVLDATALPAPPGITEIVLDEAHPAVFKEMRSHLTSVRRYHKIVLWALIVAFMTFFGVGVFKLISKVETLADYFQAFGSAGIGGLLFWFGQRTLWANRVSQLSLALFESHVAEVSVSLREIPKSASPDERRRIRSHVWSDFRTGLNRIWLTERDLLERTGRPPLSSEKP
jgi:hypothetical protein